MSDIVPVDLNKVIESAKASGQLDTLIGALVKESDVKESVENRRSNKQQRMDQWKVAKESQDLDKVQALSDTMTNFVERHYVDRVEMLEPRVLTQDEVDSLGSEVRDIKRIEDFIAGRYQALREMIFTSLDESIESDRGANSQDDTPAGQVPGQLKSEKAGVKFCREGGKRKAPTIDWKEIEQSLPPEEFRKVCKAEVVPEVVIPEHVEYTPDEDALMQAVISGQISMDVMRRAVVPGAWQTPRFQVREI